MICSVKKTGGYIVVAVLVFTTIAMVIVTGLANWAGLNLHASQAIASREKAFQVAEAGIEYYRWHLAHSPQDFRDGQSASSTGPYTHNYYDKNGNLIGHFALTITPPLVGSTVVTIDSKGTVTEDTSVSRTIEAKMAIASLAKFAFVSNSTMRFGQGTEVFGPIHSNNGIRFDGLAHNIVTSAVSSYDDPDHSGSAEYGVHTHVNQSGGDVSDSGLSSELASHSPIPIRNDVFLAGRQFPVPAVDWNGLTATVNQLETTASQDHTEFSRSNASGYNIILKTNGTFDLYKVTSLTSLPHNCSDPGNQDGWGSWSINSQTFIANYAFPAHGIVFLEDNVWVEGQINNARLTIVASTFPDSTSGGYSITFNKNILYTNYDGRDVLSLIAQNNINAGMASADTIEVDGALVAKNGRIGRYYYESDCDPYDNRTQIKLYGMLATNQRYGFAYTDNTGYATRIITYDANLLYGPPPSFPLTSDQYTTISWREI